MIDVATVTALLQEGGHLDRGEVVSVEAQPSNDFGNASTRYHLHVTYSEPVGLPRDFYLKIGKPDWFDDSRTEVDFLRDLHVLGHLPTPPVYGLRADSATRELLVLLPDLSRTHASGASPHAAVPLPMMHRVMTTLASLHAAAWQHPLLEETRYAGFASAASLTSILAQLRDGMADFIKDVPGLGDSARMALTADIEPVFDAHVTGMAAGVRTLEHGDLHAANVLFPRREQDDLLLIDWQTARTGTGMSDVALIVFNSLTTAERQVHQGDLLASYHDRLVALGVSGYSRADCLSQYRMQMLLRVIYPVGERAQGFPQSIWRHSLDKAAAIYEEFT